jgi:hypothetical protein
MTVAQKRSAALNSIRTIHVTGKVTPYTPPFTPPYTPIIMQQIMTRSILLPSTRNIHVPGGRGAFVDTAAQGSPLHEGRADVQLLPGQVMGGGRGGARADVQMYTSRGGSC